MKVKCPDCQSFIELEKIDFEKSAAHCNKCQADKSVDGELSALLHEYQSMKTLPDQCRLVRVNNVLQIRKNYLKVKAIPLILVLLFLNAIIAYILIDGFELNPASLMLIAFLMAICLSPLIFIFLFAICRKTVIQVDQSSLRTKHIPMIFNQKSIPLNEIEKVFMSYKTDKSDIYHYNLSLKLKSGRQLEILKGIKISGLAIFLANEISNRLHS